MYIRVGAVFAALLAAMTPARAGVTVFLEHNGFVTEDGVKIPRFGGGEATWNAVVACVKKHYAPFAVEIVDTRPSHGQFITAVMGGRASQLGLDDETTDGVGPFDGDVEPDAVVHVFSQTSGEQDVENLCAVTAHEVGHALGLDHELYCGDIMSYYTDQCGARSFVDAEAPCGETEERECPSGEATQSSYRRLGELVGFRDGRAPASSPLADRDRVRHGGGGAWTGADNQRGGWRDDGGRDDDSVARDRGGDDTGYRGRGDRDGTAHRNRRDGGSRHRHHRGGRDRSRGHRTRDRDDGDEM